LKSDGTIDTYQIYPEDIGLKRGKIEEVAARPSHLENAKVTVGVLSRVDNSSRRDLILLNAASILYLADEVKDIKDGYELAKQSVDDGEAIQKLRELVTLSGGRRENLEWIINSLE
jgi:anthranilate phosphoribosyltransferase